jgi:hypothetical protein
MPFLDHTAGAPGVIVATDSDPAGQMAAERDYWTLTARGADPRHATFPDGHDPASLLREAGPAALRAQLVASRPLAEALVDERLAHLRPTTALSDAVSVIAAGHAAHWTQRTEDVSRRLHAPKEVALTQLLERITTWDSDRHAASAHQVHAVNDVRQRVTAQTLLPPATRWAYLIRQVDLNLVRADDWGALAATLDRAVAFGHDLSTLLTEVIGTNPLADDEPAADLRYRLMERLGADKRLPCPRRWPTRSLRRPGVAQPPSHVPPRTSVRPATQALAVGGRDPASRRDVPLSRRGAQRRHCPTARVPPRLRVSVRAMSLRLMTLRITAAGYLRLPDPVCIVSCRSFRRCRTAGQGSRVGGW